MADEFNVEGNSVEGIRVRHLPMTTVISSPFVNMNGRRFLGAGPIIGNSKAEVAAMTLREAARAFAEDEAREGRG
jgi:hypothetical protein